MRSFQKYVHNRLSGRTSAPASYDKIAVKLSRSQPANAKMLLDLTNSSASKRLSKTKKAKIAIYRPEIQATASEVIGSPSQMKQPAAHTQRDVLVLRMSKKRSIPLIQWRTTFAK
jgi:hypothetical protein